jgi:alpha-beta hydrolase superfamily lysophospholipase
VPRGPSEWSLDGNGAHFSVRVWRPDGAPRGAVCIIHGLGEHSRRYVHVGHALASRGFAVIAPDLRGHGRSSGPRGHSASIGQLLEDLSLLRAAAHERFGVSPAWTLYGHSLGGALALAQALRHPATIAACVVTGPAIRPAFVPPVWKVALGHVLRRIAPSVLMHNEVDANGLSHVDNIVRDYRADPLVHDRISTALGIDLLDLGDELLADAHTLTVPTLIIHGGADPITSPRASREFAKLAGPICTYVEVEGSYHEVHHEASWDETWRVIAGWIDATLPLAHTH